MTQQEEDNEELRMVILNREDSHIDFWHWWLTNHEWLLGSCFNEKQKVKVEAHKAACDRLSNEMDVLDLVRSARIAKFIA